VRFLDPKGKDLIPRKDRVWSVGGIANRMVLALRAAKRDVPNYLSLLVQEAGTKKTKKATFAMHCFWEGEARLGSLNGVLNTRSAWLQGKEVVEVTYDEGAIGYGGVMEKDIVLPVSMRIGKLLEERLGVNVVYTRTDDRFIPLDERGHIANEAGGKLFVSIHTNAAPDHRARRTETFFLGMHKTDAARTVMERESQVFELENDPDRYAGYDQSALITKVLAQSSYMSHSQMLASLIQNEFDRRPDNVNRGVKQAGFYVLWSAYMPAVLVELGFLTNPREASWMRSVEGQKEIADAIVRAIEAFETSYVSAIGDKSSVAGAGGRD